MSHWSRGVQISGVRFWNLTASQPASAAASISAKRVLQVAVVVDADLADDVDGLAGADGGRRCGADGCGGECDGGSTQWVVPSAGARIHEAISRIALRAVRRVVGDRAAAPRTTSWASATATGQPTRPKQARSLTSLPT